MLKHSTPAPALDDRHETAALNVNALAKSYNGRTVLDGVDFSVHRGELVAFLGANGSGKSTTLKCVAGLAEPDAGQIELNGVSLAGLHGKALATARSQAAMVFQKIHLVPRRTALDNVCAGALARLGGAASLSPLFFSRAVRQEAMDCLERVGMAERALEKVGRLSGGQQQRVAVARALCQRASVLLADEPVSALDPNAAEHIMALLAELAHEQNLAVAAVLHQPDLAVRHADRAIGLLGGRIVFDGPTHLVTSSVQEQLYSPERTAA